MKTHENDWILRWIRRAVVMYSWSKMDTVYLYKQKNLYCSYEV